MEEEKLNDYGTEGFTDISSMGVAARGHTCQAIAVYPFSPEGSQDIAIRAPMRKLFWVAGSAGWAGGKFPCVIGTPEEYLLSANVAVATASLVWTDLFEESEPRPDVWRGIFSPIYDQKVLFSQELIVRTVDLPRWQPHVTIDRRTLEGRTEND